VCGCTEEVVGGVGGEEEGGVGGVKGDGNVVRSEQEAR